MELTTFFSNGTKQITKLSPMFFRNDKKSNVFSALELEQKAKSVAMDIAGEHYYNYHLEYNKIDLITDFTKEQ